MDSKTLGKILMAAGMVLSAVSLVAVFLFESELTQIEKNFGIFLVVGSFPLGNYLPLILGVILVVIGMRYYRKTENRAPPRLGFSQKP